MSNASYITIAFIIYAVFYIRRRKKLKEEKNEIQALNIQEFRQCELTMMMLSDCLNSLLMVKNGCSKIYESDHALRALIINPNFLNVSQTQINDIPALDFVSSLNSDIRNPFFLKGLTKKFNDSLSQLNNLSMLFTELSPILTKCYTKDLALDIDKALLQPAEYRKVYEYIFKVENWLANVGPITDEFYRLFNKLPSIVNRHYGKRIFGDVNHSIDHEKLVDMKLVPLDEESIRYLNTLLSKSLV